MSQHRYPHNNRRVIQVGPLTHFGGHNTWSFVYYHGQAEEMNDQYQLERIANKDDERWEAPDLVGSDTPLDHISDGWLIRLLHVNGQELWGFLWSAEASYGWDEDNQQGLWLARRRGLIVHPDDEKSYDYARKCYDERRNHL